MPWCWSKILCSTIPNPVRSRSRTSNFCIEVLCLSFYNICFWEAFDGFIHIWHGDKKQVQNLIWYYSQPSTWPVGQGHRLRILYKSFVIFFFYNFIFFAKPSMDFIHLWRDDTTLSKILRNPHPSTWHWGQGHRLWIFCVKFYCVCFCKTFDWFESCLVWMDIRF